MSEIQVLISVYDFRDFFSRKHFLELEGGFIFQWGQQGGASFLSGGCPMMGIFDGGYQKKSWDGWRTPHPLHYGKAWFMQE